MSLYNALMGENEYTPVLLGVLSLNKEVFGRFRDIYLNKECTEIIVLTRCGGNNRKNYREVFDKITKHPNYIYDYDDKFDSTYCYIRFSIPEKYQKMCKSIAPKENPKTIKELFDEQIAQMDKPGTKANETAKRIADSIQKAIDAYEKGDGKSDGGITIMKI